MATQLILLSEDVNIAPYLNRNGLYPTKILYRMEDMIDSLAFAGKDTIFMVIVHSLTRFTLPELRLLFTDLRNAAENQSQVIIMSDIELKSPDFVNSTIQNILYDGDLFYGAYTFYKDNKPYATCEDEAETGAKRKAKVINKDRKAFWNQLCELATPREAMIGDLPERHYYAQTSDTKYQDKLVTVDLFGTGRKA